MDVMLAFINQHQLLLTACVAALLAGVLVGVLIRNGKIRGLQA